MRIGTDDFTEAEWVEIEAEAPGTRYALETALQDARRPCPAEH